MEQQITVEQTHDATAQGLKNSTYHRVPGAVVKYYPDSMTADIQPMTNDPRMDLDTGAIENEVWPVIQNVRIAWPRFGDFVLVGPLKTGDPVTLEAFDLDPTTAFTAGAARSITPVNPTDVRRHGGGYWSATPTNLTGAIQSATAAAAAYILGIDGDPAQILMSKGSIQLGATGGDFLALASKVLMNLSNIIGGFNSHTHVVAGVTTGPGTVTSATPGTPLGAATSVASALIGAQ